MTRACKQQPVNSDTRTNLVILASKFPSDSQKLLQLYIELMCPPPFKKISCYTEIFLFKKDIPHCAVIVKESMCLCQHSPSLWSFIILGSVF